MRNFLNRVVFSVSESPEDCRAWAGLDRFGSRLNSALFLDLFSLLLDALFLELLADRCNIRDRPDPVAGDAVKHFMLRQYLSN